MGKTVDFEIVRRRRRLKYIIKRVSVLLLSVAAGGGLIRLHNLWVEVGMSTKVSDLLGSFGGTGYPVELPGGVIRDIKSMGNKLAILNDTNLYLYNSRGKIISNIQQMSDKTVLLTGDSRSLTYDVNAKTYSLHTPSRTVAGTVENSILAADLGESGQYALVTTSRQYVAEVAVYENPSEPHLFRWLSSENHVSGVSLSPGGERLAVSCVMTEDGAIRSMVLLFHRGVDERLAEVDFPDSLILRLDYFEDERIGVLTDREYAVLDGDGNILHRYSLGDGQVTAFTTYGREALLLTEDKEARRSDIILLDETCTEKARLTAARNIRGMAMGRRRIYILDDTGIESFDHSLNSMEKLELRGISSLHLVGEKLYYCTEEEICLL
jgi:hypothetical protein